jgi:hypothetical protein
MDIKKNNKSEKELNDVVVDDSDTTSGYNGSLSESNDELTRHNVQYQDNKNWDTENVQTIRKWQREIEKSSFIYGMILENTDRTLMRILAMTLVISTVCALLSTISASLDGDKYKSIIFSFNIILAVLSSIILILNGLIRIYGWDDDVKNISKFVEKLYDRWIVFETELTVPANQRHDGIEFIKKHDGLHITLMQQAPYVPHSKYKEGCIKFKKFVKDECNNHVWEQKFRKNI